MADEVVSRTLSKVKETKGTIVFAVDTEFDRPFTIYVLKGDARALGNPEQIDVTITPA